MTLKDVLSINSAATPEHDFAVSRLTVQHGQTPVFKAKPASFFAPSPAKKFGTFERK